MKDDAVLVIAPAKLFDKGDGSIRLTGQFVGETFAGSGNAPGESNLRWSAKRTAAYTPPKKADEKPSPLDKPLDFPETYPAGAFGRLSAPDQSSVLIQGATIWTSGPQGTLQNADLLVTAGKISAVGPGLKAPGGATIFDGKGMHVTPGIIDCHSHTAISRGVNEARATPSPAKSGSATSSMPTDIGIYRELAGGVTTANRSPRIGEPDRRTKPGG